MAAEPTNSSEVNDPGISEQEIKQLSQESESERAQNKLTWVIIGVIVVWTYLYNVLIKEQGPVESFFRILDTVSDDFVMGALVTILVGVGIVAVFSFTKLYTQITANVYSFKLIEDLMVTELGRGNIRRFCARMLNFGDEPPPIGVVPTRAWSLLLSFGFIYVMSWVYLVLFSEALFFISWSAGVNLPINAHNLLMMPTLALAIPFSARVMAYLHYPYTQDYADFMPGAVFVLLIVVTLGYLFQSDDQKFFVQQVWQNETFLVAFLKNGLFLAFVPVFFEGLYWLRAMNQSKTEGTMQLQALGPDDVQIPQRKSPPPEAKSDE